MYESIYEPIDIIKLTKIQPSDLLGIHHQLQKHLAAVNSVIESCYINKVPFFSQHHLEAAPKEKAITIPKVEAKSKPSKVTGKKRGRKPGSINKKKSEAIQIAPDIEI